MLRVENLTKSFGDRLIFEAISFVIGTKERVGVVGRNGHGKTTLLRLITGQEQPDSGAVIIPKNYRIGYVRQNLEFTADTALNETIQALPATQRDQHWKAEKILTGLGFDPHDFQRHPAEFSGGFQVRLNLAKTLVGEPDLLLLDEPTNFLDIASIRWIEQFLGNWPHELILITHDRSFMDSLVTHTLGIHRCKVRKISGNTGKYYDQIAQDEEIYEKTRLNDERRRKDIELFITRFRAKARLANLVQSRIKTLQKMEKKEKLDELKTLDFSFRSLSLTTRQALTVRELCFAYDGQKTLIKDFAFTVGAREKICIIGKNGKGKTTLLKLLAGALKQQSGQIAYHPGIKKGFFEQTNVKSLVDARTVEEEIIYAGPDVDRQQARNICGAMMFSGDDALKKISVLSGGEKSRVMLGKLLVTPTNLLLLDEPTNHLDMESCDALLAAIDSFPYTVIMVTHNEMFLHTLAERLIVFQKDQVDVFNGSYQQFLDKCGWQNEHPNGLPGEGQKNQHPVGAKLNRKEIRRRKSEIIARRSRAVKPLQQNIVRLENNIETREAEMDLLNDSMQQASQNQDGRLIAELSRSIHGCQSAIDGLFDELEKITDELDSQNTVFETQLKQLE
jgi:ATP-binding cassette subfamily F protein 3